MSHFVFSFLSHLVIFQFFSHRSIQAHFLFSLILSQSVFFQSFSHSAIRSYVSNFVSSCLIFVSVFFADLFRQAYLGLFLFHSKYILLRLL